MTNDPQKPWPFPTADNHPPLEPCLPKPVEPSEAALDHGIEESFPASDPVSVVVTTVEKTGEPATPQPEVSDVPPPGPPSARLR